MIKSWYAKTLSINENLCSCLNICKIVFGIREDIHMYGKNWACLTTCVCYSSMMAILWLGNCVIEVSIVSGKKEQLSQELMRISNLT